MRVRPCGLRSLLFQAAIFSYINTAFFVVHFGNSARKSEDSEFPFSFTGPLKLQPVTTSIGCAESKQ